MVVTLAVITHQYQLEMNKYQIIKDCLLSNRSYRRFDNSRLVEYSVLTELVNLTRFCASAMNKQSLRYRIVHIQGECDKIFPHLKWAGFLQNWEGPTESERPVAYLVQCLDTNCSSSLASCDAGLHLEAITLGMTALGLGGCIIKAFNGTKISEILSLPKNILPQYVLAIGYPIEIVVIDEMTDGDFKYWRDKDNIHHVPKRSLKDIII
jgi:nitroreductase